MADRAAASAAQRRRIRRLLCQWRHEQLVGAQGEGGRCASQQGSDQVLIHETAFVIHETEFFEMSLNISSVSRLEVFMDFDAVAQVDDALVPRFGEGAGERERVPQRTAEQVDDGLFLGFFEGAGEHA